MKLRLSISTGIIGFGLLLTIGFVAVVATGNYALRELKVGGPLYTDIKLGNDLIADILPPPAYVLEAYLEATLAMREPDQLASHRERLVQLRKDYDDRKSYWSASNLAPDLKSALIVQSDAEVQKFWKLVSDDLLPALTAARHSDAERAYQNLKSVYAAHRGIIDAIVERLLAIALGVVRPIVRMTAAMQQLAAGDLGAEVPFADRRDEVGSMATALQVFKDAAIERGRLR